MSIDTTNLGPRVSFTTTGTNDPSAGRVAIDVPLDVTGAATISGAATHSGAATFSGVLSSTGTIDASAGVVLSKQTATAPTTSIVADGELSVTSVSVTSAVISFRSGNTIYNFVNATAE